MTAMADISPDTGSEADYTKLVPLIWTLLRLLGVYFFVVGMVATLEDSLEVFGRWREDIDRYGDRILLDYFFPQFWGSLIYLATGIYLLVGGRWLIDKVFLPAKAAESGINEGAEST
jgi:hypothetical protein